MQLPSKNTASLQYLDAHHLKRSTICSYNVDKISSFSDYRIGGESTMRATDDSSRSGVDSPSTQSRPGMRRRLGSNDDASSSARVNVSLHSSSGQRRNILRHAMSLWMPAEEEITNRSPRSWRRRVFLIITEPETSILSAVFYILLMSGIFVVNIIMVMQTMESWQYTPTDCVTCGGYVNHQ